MEDKQLEQELIAVLGDVVIKDSKWVCDTGRVRLLLPLLRSIKNPTFVKKALKVLSVDDKDPDIVRGMVAIDNFDSPEGPEYQIVTGPGYLPMLSLYRTVFEFERPESPAGLMKLMESLATSVWRFEDGINHSFFHAIRYMPGVLSSVPLEDPREPEELRFRMEKKGRKVFGIYDTARSLIAVAENAGTMFTSPLMIDLRVDDNVTLDLGKSLAFVVDAGAFLCSESEQEDK